MRRILPTFLALILGAAPLAAQVSPVPRAGTPPASADAATRLRYLARLPVRTTELRNAGVADSAIQHVLSIFRDQKLDPVQADEILVVERDAAREHGPTDNFGAFIQTQLSAGKRGQALADAIRAEHQAHGRGSMEHRAEQAKERDKDEHERTRTNPQGQGRDARGRRPQ